MNRRRWLPAERRTELSTFVLTLVFGIVMLAFLHVVGAL